MKSLRNLGNEPIALPLVIDDITELHAARLILLLKLCGTSGRIEGLTKLAKLDFFVRYPSFFQRIADYMKRSTSVNADEVDSEMVRHHYGPWDKRYYSVLPYLESRRLITISKESKAFTFTLTQEGVSAAKRLEKLVEFNEQASRMREVKRLLGSKSGSALKDLVYKVFEQEVANKSLGEMIQ